MTVILVRHGTTEFNEKSGKGASAERVRSWVDVPLDKEGYKDARRAANALADVGADELRSSPLKRAVATAEAIGEVQGLPVKPTDELMPWNMGRWAGKKVKDMMPAMDRALERDTETPPRGEPYKTFRLRFLGWLVKELQRNADNKTTLIAVTHTRNIQAARAWVAKGSPEDLTVDTDVANDYDDEVENGDALVLKLQGEQ